MTPNILDISDIFSRDICMSPFLDSTTIIILFIEQHTMQMIIILLKWRSFQSSS